MIFLLFLILSFFNISGIAAQPVLNWQRPLGGTNQDQSYSVFPASDGGYITAAGTTSDDGDVSGYIGSSDAWVVRLDGGGNILWQRAYGGTDWEEAVSVREVADGGFVFAAYTQSSDGDITGFHGGTDMWIVRTDFSGAILWKKTLGGSGGDYPSAVRALDDGGFLVGGFTTSADGDVSFNHGANDFWLVKLDSVGNMLWEKSFGGSDIDNLLDLQETPDGGSILCGVAYSWDGDVTGQKGGGDYWIVKLDINGALQWQKTLGGADGDQANSITFTPDGGYIVTGYVQSTGGDVSGNMGGYDAWTVKLDSDGAVEWKKCMGGSGWDYGSVIRITDGGYLMAGYTQSNDGDVAGNHGYYDYWILKTDIFGNILWQKTLGGDTTDIAISMEETSTGNIVIAGYTVSDNGDVSGNHGSTDGWVVELGLVTGVSIREDEHHYFSFYPVPASDQIHISVNAEVKFGKVEIIDMFGKRQIAEEWIMGQEVILCPFRLPSGLYIINLFNEDRELIESGLIPIFRI